MRRNRNDKNDSSRSNGNNNNSGSNNNMHSCKILHFTHYYDHYYLAGKYFVINTLSDAARTWYIAVDFVVKWRRRSEHCNTPRLFLWYFERTVPRVPSTTKCFQRIPLIFYDKKYLKLMHIICCLLLPFFCQRKKDTRIPAEGTGWHIFMWLFWSEK